MAFDYINWIFLPLAIFLARILDVSIGTVRIVFVSKGYKKLASVLGFFEVLVWIVIIGELMSGDNIKFVHYVFYALGFAAGNYIGILIENKILMGKVIFRIIIPKKSEKFLEKLEEENYNFTTVDGKGKIEEVKIIFLIISRKKTKKLIECIENFDKKIFYSIEEVKFSSDDNPLNPMKKRRSFLGNLRKLK